MPSCCGRYFATDKAFCQHLNDKHSMDVNYSDNTGNYFCNRCETRKGSRRFSSLNRFVEHLEDQHDYCFDWEDHNSQERRVYEESCFKCEQCDRRFKCKQGWCSHMNALHGTEVNYSSSGQWFCNVCDGKHGGGKRFGHWVHLQGHLEDVHGVGA